MLTSKYIFLKFPFLRRVWPSIRERKILKNHKLVSNFWRPILKKMVDGELETYSFQPKVKFTSDNIIWQYWGQGIGGEDLPEVVRVCFASVDQYAKNYTVVRLSDDNITDYIDLPEFVSRKRESNQDFNKTFFSDLLRLALLATYGGIWFDATILLTGDIPEEIRDADYFVYQRDPSEKNKQYWEASYAYYWGWQSEFKVRMLNSIIFAKRGNLVVKAMLDLILFYWKTEDRIIDYFFFQIAYDILVTTQFKSKKCTIVSDVIPHLLQASISNPNNGFIKDEDVFATTTIHKMTYYEGDALDRFKSLVYHKLLL